LETLAQSPVVADLLTLCRALASDADRLAWMALLRAPWCGLRLADLQCVAEHDSSQPYMPVWQILQRPDLYRALSSDGTARVQRILPPLRRARDRRDRLGL